MELPDPSFADEFNAPQKYVVLVFDVRRAVASLPFQIHRLKVLVKASLVAFSIAYFEFADEVPKIILHCCFPVLLTHINPPFLACVFGANSYRVAGVIYPCGFEKK